MDLPGNYAGDVDVTHMQARYNPPVHQPLPSPAMTTRAHSKAFDLSKPVFTDQAGKSFGDNGIAYIQSSPDVTLRNSHIEKCLGLLTPF